MFGVGLFSFFLFLFLFPLLSSSLFSLLAFFLLYEDYRRKGRTGKGASEGEASASGEKSVLQTFTMEPWEKAKGISNHQGALPFDLLDPPIGWCQGGSCQELAWWRVNVQLVQCWKECVRSRGRRVLESQGLPGKWTIMEGSSLLRRSV